MNVGNIVFNESPTNIEASIYPEFFFYFSKECISEVSDLSNLYSIFDTFRFHTSFDGSRQWKDERFCRKSFSYKLRIPKKNHLQIMF